MKFTDAERAVIVWSAYCRIYRDAAARHVRKRGLGWIFDYIPVSAALTSNQ